MYIVKSESTDAYFNIALEEYLIKNFENEFFVTAVNEPSIIVGAHQYTYDEINALYVRQNDVKVVRRLSGGGTVFQDQGNINFSHIYYNDGSKINDFSKVCTIILNFVRDKLNLESEFAGRNDLVIDGKKFSGHARLKIDGKILHHGTLLVSSNMKSLVDALKFNQEKYADRALRSTHERVTNLSEHFEESLSVEKVFELFLNYLRSIFPDAVLYELTKDDIDNVNKLVEEKYSTWDWNYGHELNLPLYNTGSNKYGNFELYIKEEGGTIEEIKIFGDFFSKNPISEVEEKLIGCKLSKKAVKDELKDLDFKNYFSGIELDEFAETFEK